MNDSSESGNDPDRDEATTARLLRLAGRRKEIPSDVEARVYARVHREWKASSARPDGKRVYEQVRRAWMKGPVASSRRRLAVPLAVAASAILAIAVVLQPAPPTVPEALTVASVVRVIGNGAASNLPAEGHPVNQGDRLTTGAGEGISLRLTSNESLRLGENTIVAFTGKQGIRLLQGRVYADTGEFVYREGGIAVQTDLGVVTDIGTRFSVAYEENLLDVAVREGRVDVQNDVERLVAVAGERMQLSRSNGVVVGTLAADDPFWDWATALAPAFDIENKSLHDFLRWAARETGRELVFQNDELRMAAMRTDVHGPVSTLKPAEAVPAVLATTSFRHRIDANKLVIER